MAAPVPISKEAANEIEILAKMVHRIRIILMSYIGTAVSGRQRLLVRKKKKSKADLNMSRQMISSVPAPGQHPLSACFVL